MKWLSDSVQGLVRSGSSCLDVGGATVVEVGSNWWEMAPLSGWEALRFRLCCLKDEV